MVSQNSCLLVMSASIARPGLLLKLGGLQPFINKAGCLSTDLKRPNPPSAFLVTLCPMFAVHMR